MAMAGNAGSTMAPNTMAQAVVTSRRFSERIPSPVMNVCTASLLLPFVMRTATTQQVCARPSEHIRSMPPEWCLHEGETTQSPVLGDLVGYVISRSRDRVTPGL